MLKIRKLSSTCSSCLFVTVRLILSYSSASERGICVRRRWYESVGLGRIRSDATQSEQSGRRDVHELRGLIGLGVVRHREVDVEQVDLQPTR